MECLIYMRQKVVELILDGSSPAIVRFCLITYYSNYRCLYLSGVCVCFEKREFGPERTPELLIPV